MIRRTLFGLLWFALFWGKASIGMSAPSEYQIKAAYLFNFLNFVAWPEHVFNDKNSPMDVCILGQDPFENILDLTFEGKMIGARKVMIHRWQTMSLTHPCHLLFIGVSEAEHMTRILALLEDKPILTISDVEDFVHHQGMVQFIIVEHKVRFRVNRKAIQHASLYMSANLLRLAQPTEEAK